MALAGWMVLGLIVGLVPLDGHRENWTTLVLNPVIAIAGAVLGGWAYTQAVLTGGTLGSMGIAGAGGILFLTAYRMMHRWAQDRR